MQKEMDNLFDRFVGVQPLGAAEHGGLWAPSIESYVKDGTLMIKAEIPGVDAKDLEVTVADRELVIKGERKAEKDEKKADYTYREISYGAFERRFMLPEGVKLDELKAKFANGILDSAVPVPVVPKAKKIEIETMETPQIVQRAEAKKAA
jgi:HSP20 family protein